MNDLVDVFGPEEVLRLALPKLTVGIDEQDMLALRGVLLFITRTQAGIPVP